MKLLSIGLILLLSACMPHYANVPVDDITKGSAEPTKKVKRSKRTKRTRSPKVRVSEDLTASRKAKSTAPKQNKNSAKDRSTDNSRVGTGGKVKVVKPLEVAAVDSKPANTLLAQANTAISQGNYSKAEALLERALRISPRDPKLWYKMSQVKYAKGDYRQASAMAMRSNTMTSSAGMKKQNWRIIANSREKLGDMAGAEQARRYASK